MSVSRKASQGVPRAIVTPQDIHFECPACEQSLVVHEAGEGRILDCPRCAIKLIVPGKSPPRVPASARPLNPATLGRVLLKAAADGNRRRVAKLVRQGADPEFRDRDGRTVLMTAVAGGHTEVVQLLLDHGVDTEAKGRDGHTALAMAERDERYRIVRLLWITAAKNRTIIERLVERVRPML